MPYFDVFHGTGLAIYINILHMHAHACETIVSRTINVGDIMAKIAANGKFIEETIGNEAWRCDSCGTSLDNWCGCDTRFEDVEDDLEVVIAEFDGEMNNMEYRGYFTDASVSYPFVSSVVEGHLILDEEHNIVDAIIGDISLQTFLENGVDIKPVFMDVDDPDAAVFNYSVEIGVHFPYVVHYSLIEEIEEMCKGKDQVVLDAGYGTGWPCWHASDAKDREYKGGTRWRLKYTGSDPSWSLYVVEYEVSYMSGVWTIAEAADDLARLIVKLRNYGIKGTNDIV